MAGHAHIWKGVEEEDAAPERIHSHNRCDPHGKACIHAFTAGRSVVLALWGGVVPTMHCGGALFTHLRRQCAMRCNLRPDAAWLPLCTFSLGFLHLFPSDLASSAPFLWDSSTFPLRLGFLRTFPLGLLHVFSSGWASSAPFLAQAQHPDASWPE